MVQQAGVHRLVQFDFTRSTRRITPQAVGVFDKDLRHIAVFGVVGLADATSANR
jgi:hypothetical protein